MEQQGVYEAVDRLGHELRGVELRLAVPGATDTTDTLRSLIAQIDDYILPRLERLDAPLLAVVGGSTGAGKSTLVNSLIGRVVSASGVLRPTTTTPVLVCNPEDVRWFNSGRILPSLPRLSGVPKQGARGLYLVADADVPAGLALLDAPDVDSVVEANRALAQQLLAAADLWLFVTTAARYADAVPWSLLRAARERSTAMAMVLNRVPEEAATEVPEHLADMMRKEGLGGTPILTLREAELHEGMIGEGDLAPVRDWLDGLAADPERRNRIIRSTLSGAVDSISQRVAEVAEHMDAQRAAAEGLAADAERAYDAALREVEEGLSGGPALRSEVLARWHEFIGTGDVMRGIQTALGRVRDRIGDALMGRPPADVEVRSAVEHSIATVVIAAADKAAERTIEAWRVTPAGEALAREDLVPRRSSPELPESVDAQIRAWQTHVLELVKAQGADKRAAGRAVSIGVNGVGAALMLLVFAQTGGLTGGEVVIAGGTAALSERLLEALFGDQAVRDLTNAARSDLLRRIRGLVAAEAARFTSVAHDHAPDGQQVQELRAAAVAVERARL